MNRQRWLAIGAAVATAAAVVTLTVSTGMAGARHGSQPDEEESEKVLAVPYSTTGSCGVERWSVKTGTDADAGKINLGSTTPTTIAALDGLAAPANLPANNRVQPTETTVYRIQATLTEYKLESDSDYHLVIDDGAGHTMIAEIPDPACVGAGSPLLAGIQNARTEFDAKYTPTGSFQPANVPVTVTGVGFFDYLHGQTGVAPNGIELHAVTDVSFGGSPPPTTTTPPPTTTTAPPPACGASGNILANPGFESGTASWTAAAGVIGQNGPSEPAHSGTWDAWLDGYGATHTDTVAQTVTIPTGCANSALSFWLHIDTAEPLTAAYDTLQVQLLDSTGAVLTTLATYSNTDAATGYHQHTFGVGGYAGQTVTLQFTGTEDYTKQTSFVLDDTALTVG